ncbi:MAG TPA: carboxymuconolactone decarboxylase family protein [Planctomycetota bacterium]|nr:carboxymuconolactone decarboxylase family protein [Planctomycetota bacterium]
MAWMKMIDPDKAEGKAKEVLDAIKKKVGRVPNTYKVMAVTPEWLEKLLALNAETFKKGALDSKTKHLIAFAVSAALTCEYCVAAHLSMAQGHGATHEEIAEAMAAAATISLYNTYNKAIGLECDIKPKTD